MARLAALGRVHSDGGRRRPVASAGNSIPVSAPNPKSRSIAYCSSGVSRAANLAMAMLLETRIASAMVSEGCGSSSVIVRPSTRHLPPSPDTRSMGDTRRSESNAATAKIFARDPGSNVSGEGGKWRVLGRTITDDDPQPSLTMADAIRVSSNIAIAKFAARLTPEEQYAMLRDFGFGALTGIEFPAEATGRLRPPSEWTRPSAASLAMGYELSVTPIQVAMAYGALANDGLLLEPTLIREV